MHIMEILIYLRVIAKFQPAAILKPRTLWTGKQMFSHILLEIILGYALPTI